MADFIAVTELSGDDVSQEQFERLCNRYYWARKFCIGKDVLEVACGTGQGLGYLAEHANSIIAGDYSGEILKAAKAHYGDRITLLQFDAQEMPFPDNSMDVIIIFEAIYYLPSVEKFICECRRVLRKDGRVLVATANKDLFDFNPSPYSFKYYGIVELNKIFTEYGYSVEVFGNTAVDIISWRQKIFRPVKKIAVMFGLTPKSMNSKKFFKRLVFGRLVKMPAEVREDMVTYIEPAKLSSNQPDKKYKVIYCVATLSKD